MQLNTSICNRELPINPGLLSVAPLLVCLHLSPKHFFIPYPTIQTLPIKYAQLYLCHIQPTAVLWRRMQFQLLCNSPCLAWLECLIKRGYLMCVEIIQHYSDYFRLRVSLIYQPLHLMREVYFGSSLCYCNVTPTRLRLTDHKQIPHPVALVLIVIASHSASFALKSSACLGNQLFAGLIKVYFRALFIIGFGIQVQNIFHASYKFGVDLPDAPLLFQPRLESVFFSTRRTVSYEQESVSFNST